jgi:NhaP-type Na+/H+ or K+/H+ antiporter
MVYGVVGTLITFFIIAPISCVINNYEYYDVKFTMQQLMIFSALISSTDTIACLTFIHEDTDPKLFSLLFGEGVINDAVTICLYQLVSKYNPDKDGINVGMFVELTINFVYLFVFSLLIGVVVGVCCSLFLKHMKRFKFNRVQENLVIFFFAFFSYGIPQVLSLSPIISLLFCAMFMSHYSYFNLSFQAREESCVVSKVLSDMAAAFVYTYLGLTCLSKDPASFSLNFAAIQFCVVALGRYLTVYILAYLIK